MYKDSLVKYRSRFLITTFLFVTRKEWTLNTCFIISYFFLWKIRCTIILYCFAIHSITSISGSLSNVCWYVLALVVRLLGISYLVLEDEIHQGVCNDIWKKKCIGIKLMKRTCTVFGLVWFVFYGPSTHFRSFRARSVNLATLFLGKPPMQFTST